MVDKKGKKSAEDVAADMKKIQKLRNPKKNAKDYDPGTIFVAITVGLVAVLLGLQLFEAKEFVEEGQSGATVPQIKDIEYSRSQVRVHLTKHPKKAKQYYSFVQRKRSNPDNFHYLAEKTTGIQNTVELEVDIYETYEYEVIIRSDIGEQEVRRSFEVGQLPGKLFEDEDQDVIQRVQAVFQEERPYLEIAEFIEEANKEKNIPFLQYMQAYGLVMHSTKLEMSEMKETLVKAIEILYDVGTDESVLVDVRSRALTLAMDRSAVTEQFENAIEVGEMLLSLNPDRNYDIMKHLGDVYLAGAKYEKAVEIYEKLLKMDPSEGVARARLGAALFHLDRYEEASDLLKAGIDSKEPGTEGDYFRTKFIQAKAKLLESADEPEDGDDSTDAPPGDSILADEDTADAE